MLCGVESWVSEKCYCCTGENPLKEMGLDSYSVVIEQLSGSALPAKSAAVQERGLAPGDSGYIIPHPLIKN